MVLGVEKNAEVVDDDEATDLIVVIVSRLGVVSVTV